MLKQRVSQFNAVFLRPWNLWLREVWLLQILCGSACVQKSVWENSHFRDVFENQRKNDPQQENWANASLEKHFSKQKPGFTKLAFSVQFLRNLYKLYTEQNGLTDLVNRKTRFSKHGNSFSKCPNLPKCQLSRSVFQCVQKASLDFHNNDFWQKRADFRTLDGVGQKNEQIHVKNAQWAV